MKLLIFVREKESDNIHFASAAEKLAVRLDIKTYAELVVAYAEDSVCLSVNGNPLETYTSETWAYLSSKPTQRILQRKIRNIQGF